MRWRWDLMRSCSMLRPTAPAGAAPAWSRSAPGTMICGTGGRPRCSRSIESFSTSSMSSAFRSRNRLNIDSSWTSSARSVCERGRDLATKKCDGPSRRRGRTSSYTSFRTSSATTMTGSQAGEDEPRGAESPTPRRMRIACSKRSGPSTVERSSSRALLRRSAPCRLLPVPPLHPFVAVAACRASSRRLDRRRSTCRRVPWYATRAFRHGIGYASPYGTSSVSASLRSPSPCVDAARVGRSRCMAPLRLPKGRPSCTEGSLPERGRRFRRRQARRARGSRGARKPLPPAPT